MNYKDFYKSLYNEQQAHQALDEEKFKRRKNLTHVADVPMFSIYVSDAVSKNPDKAKLVNLESIKRSLSDARNEIHKIGFPSMHVNVVIDDIKKSYPLVTGGAAGLAVQNQFMVIDVHNLDETKRIAVHEWAHLWMAQKPKLFKKAILDVYNNIMSVASSKTVDVTYDDLLSGESSPKYKLAAHLAKLVPDKIYHRMLDYWMNYFNGLMFNNKITSQYRLFSKKFTKNLVDALPMGLRFETTIKQPITMMSLSRGGSIVLPTDSKVYVEKGNSLWIVGTEQNDTTYEGVVKYENAEKMLGSDMYDKIDQILKLHSSVDKMSKKQLESEILFDMKHNVRNAFKMMVDRYMQGYKPSNKEYATLEMWVEKYVYPMYLYVLRNTKEYNKVNDFNASERYSYFWIQNKLRPADVSFMRFSSFIYNRELMSKQHTQGDRALTGGEHYETRKILAELVEWVNEYGLSNNLELWATAIELFFKLPFKYRTTIVKLMV